LAEMTDTTQSSTPAVAAETGDNERVRTALAQLTELIKWVDERYRIALPGDPRSRMANGCFDVALEHQGAIQLLARCELYGSMLALGRVLLEAFMRGCWLARCASDEELEHFRTHDEIRKSFETLVIEVERALGNQLSTLLTLKRNAWGVMNSFTHSGMQQIVRRNSEGATGPQYSPDDIVTGLRLAGVFGLLAAIEMATIARNEPLALATLERAKLFAVRPSTPP
jgi:hypothetical protein